VHPNADGDPQGNYAVGGSFRDGGANNLDRGKIYSLRVSCVATSVCGTGRNPSRRAFKWCTCAKVVEGERVWRGQPCGSENRPAGP
jgi:hypothetical protein